MIQQEATTIKNCIVLKPDLYKDDRGIFTEMYKKSILPFFQPVQSNYSVSKSGVLRGIHRTPYAKLVTCVKGSIYDVCLDLRPESKTYEQYFGLELNENNLTALYIPPYCGHGFLALEDSIVIYHQGSEYDQSVDETYCYKSYNIAWPSSPTIVSTKDQNACENIST